MKNHEHITSKHSTERMQEATPMNAEQIKKLISWNANFYRAIAIENEHGTHPQDAALVAEILESILINVQKNLPQLSLCVNCYGSNELKQVVNG